MDVSYNIFPEGRVASVYLPNGWRKGEFCR